jgi:AAA15 family ATPase/GTPase
MNPVIQNLQINSFRGLKGLNLSDLGWVNILVGKNNSGKTTILEAISIACNPLDPFQWIGTSERRINIGRTANLGRTVTASRPSLESIKWLFPQENSNSEDRKIEINTTGDTDISVEAIITEVYGTSSDKNDNDEDSSAESDYAKSGIYLEIFSTAPFNGQINISEDRRDYSKTRTIENFQFWEDERFIQLQRSRDRVLFNHAIVYPSYSSSDVVLAF